MEVAISRGAAEGRRVAVAMALSALLALAACGDSGPGEVGRDRAGLFVSKGSTSYSFAEIDCAETSVTATERVQRVGTGAESRIDPVEVEVTFEGNGGSVALFADGSSDPVSVGEFGGLEVDPDTGARISSVSFDGADGELSFNCP